MYESSLRKLDFFVLSNRMGYDCDIPFDSIWFKIEKNTVSTIIIHSFWKEILFFCAKFPSVSWPISTGILVVPACLRGLRLRYYKGPSLNLSVPYCSDVWGLSGVPWIGSPDAEVLQTLMFVRQIFCRTSEMGGSKCRNKDKCRTC